jgi:hypothetical protein
MAPELPQLGGLIGWIRSVAGSGKCSTSGSHGSDQGERMIAKNTECSAQIVPVGHAGLTAAPTSHALELRWHHSLENVY